MKTLSSCVAASLVVVSSLLCANDALASQDYTLVIENNGLLPTTLNKVDSHCMYQDGPESIRLEPNTSTQFVIEDKDTVIGECWSAPKTITWQFGDPADGGRFYFVHDKVGHWSTAFWPEGPGSMQITAWCGYKTNPKVEQCFGHWVKGDYDYLTVSYGRKGADVVGMNFIQGDDAKALTLERTASDNMIQTGPDRVQFTAREYFYIQRAEGNKQSIEQWKVSNDVGEVTITYVNVYNGSTMTTRIAASDSSAPGAPELDSALCDGHKCLGKLVNFVPKEVTLTFGVADPEKRPARSD